MVYRCKNGDPEALAVIYEKYKLRIFNVALRMHGNLEDAEDLAHDAFVKGFRELKSFTGNSTVGTWLYRIVVNRSLNFLARKKLVKFNRFAPEFDKEQTDTVQPDTKIAFLEEQQLIRKILTQQTLRDS